MITKSTDVKFQSQIANIIKQFIEEKKSCGYKYNEEIRQLKQFDRYLFHERLSQPELPRTIVHDWLAKRTHESIRTHNGRVCILRQLAKYMNRMGHPAYVPEKELTIKGGKEFMPYIFTHTEIHKLFKVADQLTPNARSPLRHIIMPEVLRLLYGCGLRLGEVLKLKNNDVDLNQGVLTIYQGKFNKDRLVPPALPLVHRLQRYAEQMANHQTNSFFFPSSKGGAWDLYTIYHWFRKLLLECEIVHAGRGKGPRVHDIRHTFAVHVLVRWYQEGEDINAKLPLLAAYMGHQKISSTQYYLHLTAELFPEVNKCLTAEFNDVIPWGAKS